MPTDPPLEGLAFASNGTLHVLPEDPTTWLTQSLTERGTALCGGGFIHNGYHQPDGARLTDAYLEDDLCRICLNRLQTEDATVPGFIVDGDLVGQARMHSPEGDQ